MQPTPEVTSKRSTGVFAMIKLKRVYEKPSPADGFRVLVERLWPRGFTKQRAAVDLWLKELAPSPELRKWFSHDPAKWREFQERYWAELRGQRGSVRLLKQKAREGTVTLVYAARDEQHNCAVALKLFLERRSRGHVSIAAVAGQMPKKRERRGRA